MTYLIRTILIAVCLVSLTASDAVAQIAVKNSGCTNQQIYPNSDLDNFEIPLGGKLKRVETHEMDLADRVQSDLVETVNFDESGRVTDSFLSNSKIKVFGKEIYSYDSKNHPVLKVSYNPDGTAVTEDVLTYDTTGNLKQLVTRNAKSKVIIWNKGFSYPAGNEYSELFDTGHNYGFRFRKDDRCRIIELTTYRLDRTVTSKILITYNDETNTVEESFYSPTGNLMDKKRAKFEFDENGNWIKKTTYNAAAEDGKIIYKPAVVVQRKITYFISK